MAGKKGRSGRRKGSLSWSKNPTAVAGHHLQTLIEMWLARLDPVPCGLLALSSRVRRRHSRGRYSYFRNRNLAVL